MVFDRQLDGDGGALALRACEMERSAVQFDDRLGERETETGALMTCIESAFAPMEGAHDEIDVFRRDTDAGVGDNQCEFAVLDRAVDVHRATRRRELDRIVDDIAEAELEFCAVGQPWRANDPDRR